MKTVQWRSEERQLEVLTRLKETHDCLEKFLSDHKGEPVTITLKNDTKLRGLLLEGSFGSVVTVEMKGSSLLLIRGLEIVTIMTDL